MNVDQIQDAEVSRLHWKDIVNYAPWRRGEGSREILRIEYILGEYEVVQRNEQQFLFPCIDLYTRAAT